MELRDPHVNQDDTRCLPNAPTDTARPHEGEKPQELQPDAEEVAVRNPIVTRGLADPSKSPDLPDWTPSTSSSSLASSLESKEELNVSIVVNGDEVKLGDASDDQVTQVADGSVPKGENRKPRSVKEKRKERQKRRNPQLDDKWHCSYCNVTLFKQEEFQAHCRNDQHLHAIMSDEGRSWKYRPPPRGASADTYSLCRHLLNDGCCRLGLRCINAHSNEELQEWCERFKFRQKKAQKAAKLYGPSLVDTVLDKIVAAKNPDTVVTSLLKGIECKASAPLITKVSSKNKHFSWTFHIETATDILQDVVLLNEVNRHQFCLDYIKHCGTFRPDDIGHTKTILKTFDLWNHNNEDDSPQEWTHTQTSKFQNCTSMSYRVRISFKADIFGTFRQSVIFNFGFEPFLRQDLCVDVVPEEEFDETEAKSVSELHEKLVRQPPRWDSADCDVIDFKEPPLNQPTPEDKHLLERYPPRNPRKFALSDVVLTPHLTRANYRARMHELLWIEELARFGHLTQFNVVTRLLLTTSYLLIPTSASASTAKYARKGELFAKMSLSGNLSEDTPAGRLILTNCSLVMLSKPKNEKAKQPHRRKAYVAGIDYTGKDTVYLRLSPTMVNDLRLTNKETIDMEVQFQLNRVPLCEMHRAVDQLTSLSIVYPNVGNTSVGNASVGSPPKIPWNPAKQWSKSLCSELNAKQREAIIAITTDLSIALPPILLIGPFGTGKTFTLAQAMKYLLRQKNENCKPNRILLCTHSNSAADLYIREYLDPFIEENPDLHVKLVRVYYRNRWVQTVHSVVQKYCLVTMAENNRARSFRNPVKEDIVDCDLVVATLSTSRFLHNIGLENGHFTHILIDEAAQATECQALMPLGLARASETRVVLAGDHMQLSPEVFSDFAKDKGLNKSMLERLFDLYPTSFPCRILLCQNYRSHEAIISYTSELFYEQRLVASSKQPCHTTWYPLTVFTTRGEDVQDTNSTSFYNNSEVYEVADRVAELQNTWPEAWGDRDQNSIGVVTPYYDQVQRIRNELRKRRLFGVSVERVLNVQGKQFRAIFLSTVRTRKTCSNKNDGMTECDYGFLSNAKLLNTAITRAQSLVAVVGDPVSLCSIGRCSKLWERFVELSSVNRSFFGLTWPGLRTLLDGVELKKASVLNPLAPEFIPRSATIQYCDAHFLRTAQMAAPQFLLPFQQHLANNLLAATPLLAGSLPQMMPIFPIPPPVVPPSLQGPPHLLPLVFPNNPYSTIPPYPPSLAMALASGSQQSLNNSSAPSSPRLYFPHYKTAHQRHPGLQHASSMPVLEGHQRLQIPRVKTSTANRFLYQQQQTLQQHPVQQSQVFSNKKSRSRATNNCQSASRNVSNPASFQPQTDFQSERPTGFQLTEDGPQPARSRTHGSNSVDQLKVVESENHPALSFLHLLPPDLGLDALMKSPTMQLAWYNHLLLMYGRVQADLFKEMVSTFKLRPEVLEIAQQRFQNKGDEDSRVPIKAQDLEAAFVDESSPRENENATSLPKFQDPAPLVSARSGGGQLSTSPGPRSQAEGWDCLLAKEVFLQSSNSNKKDRSVPLYHRGVPSAAAEAVATTAGGPTPNNAKSSAQSSSRAPTYANVVKANTQQAHDNCDPLTRIRNLGTQGNREYPHVGPHVQNQKKNRSATFSMFGGWP